jgi:iron complex transport system ATP-binding protein
MASTEVLRLRDVSILRDGAALLDRVSWQVREGERWVVLGPNGAGKTTLLQLAAANLHPSRGRARILGETLGAVDVFELRPRIGLSSAALADRLPAKETVRDVVLTASYAVVGRWRERYDAVDAARADVLLGEPAAGLDLGGREALVERLAALANDPLSPCLVLVTHHVEEIPPGFTHVLLLRGGRVMAAGPVETTLTADLLGVTFGIPLELVRAGDRWSARAISRVASHS